VLPGSCNILGMSATATCTSTTTRVQVLDDFKNSDLDNPTRREYHFRTPFLVTWAERLLRDTRDTPMLCLMMNILQLIVPAVPFIYYVNLKEDAPPLLVRNILGLIYWVSLVVLFQERFILMLHFLTHRPIFKIDVLNTLVNWIMVPFFGIPSGVYKLHHVVMHHIENNHEWDISSTEGYRRDSFANFLMYYFHFGYLIYAELPMYCIKSKRWEWLRRVMTGVITWSTCVFLLAKYVSFCATFWVFIWPHIFAMFVMSFGNFSQHIFVDPQQPESNYALTYNCIDTVKNRETFNDGYHVIHHLNARIHWTELPQYFHTTLDKHKDSGALTFRGLHFFDVGVLVMTGNLRRLVEKHYVHLGSRETAPTVEAVEEKLRSWLKPFTPVPPKQRKAA